LSARQNQIWSYAKKDGVYTGEKSTRYSTANTNMVKRKRKKKRIVVTNIIGKKRDAGSTTGIECEALIMEKVI
jgi:L,D-peptidoglycan transpeptidase YkuD (ErfK/YbiS/YcfS/YnhG family)